MTLSYYENLIRRGSIQMNRHVNICVRIIRYESYIYIYIYIQQYSVAALGLRTPTNRGRRQCRGARIQTAPSHAHARTDRPRPTRALPSTDTTATSVDPRGRRHGTRTAAAVKQSGIVNVPSVAAAGVVYLLKVKSRNWKRGTVDNSSAIYTDGWLGSRVVSV